ncbi:EAL domain-containing protein [Mesorhizobium sp. CAU 1741]|uniref:sensor domain-containing phosphodiesterase n=1 Tax=Mesorhizobium sp. CAU 1741 TaxID=3140366 RepID=UPI00325B40D2
MDTGGKAPILTSVAEVEGGTLTIQRALNAVRTHLGMDVAYLSEFVGNDSIFRVVDAPGLETLVKPGDARSLDDVYCRHIVEGRLPELIPDTANEPLAQSLPITKAVPIGSHVSIPIRMSDGSLYGMFCCLSARPNPSLNDRDLQVMRMFADLAAHQVSRDRDAEWDAQSRRRRIQQVIVEQAFTPVYQPICDIRLGGPVGFEALCRFAGEPYRSPDKWFAEAVEAGLGIELELAVLQAALVGLKVLPASTYVSFNASPETIVSGKLVDAFGDAPRERIVLEVTEHAPVADYEQLGAALRPLRDSGVRLAVDDAGAGFSSLQHIVQLNPDIIKLDMALTRSVDADPARRALASALIHFAHEMGSTIVAEGIESEAELSTLGMLGITKGQGFLLGRPVPLQDARLIAENSGQHRLSA